MKRKHHIRNDSSLSLFTPAPSAPSPAITRTVRIEFDGGTPCNIPRLGYGDGYGSYRIDQEPIYRLNFNIPMSANVAEITTLARAIETVAQTLGKEGVALDIHGDSQIALKWARGATENGKPTKGVKAKFALTDFGGAVGRLQEAVRGFAEVRATWRGRAASVELFGH